MSIDEHQCKYIFAFSVRREQGMRREGEMKTLGFYRRSQRAENAMLSIDDPESKVDEKHYKMCSLCSE